MFFFVVLPVITWFLVPPALTETIAVRVPFMSRIKAASVETQSHRRKLMKWIVPVTVWLFTIVALARPQWFEDPIEKTIPTRDLLLIVDLSGSMDQKDFNDEDGESIDRLSAVKDVVGDFLAHREGDRVGLIVFGNSPFLQVPFTTDLELSRRLLNETAVGMAGPRTAFGDAIGLGIKILEESDSPQKTILALTDGNDTASLVPPAEAAKVARDREITIHAIAIGDPTTVGEQPLDQDTLNDVADTAKGEYFLALDRNELEKVYERLDQLEQTEIKTTSYRPKRELFHLPLTFAIVFSIIGNGVSLFSLRFAFRRPIRKSLLRVNSRTFELESIDQ